MFNDIIGGIRDIITGNAGGITNPAIGNLGNNPAAASSGFTFLYYFVYLWRVIMAVGAIFVLIYFIWAAFEWINAGGDSGKIQKARDRIIQSFIGLIILVFSFVIVNFLSRLFFAGQFDVINPEIPTLSDGL